ncbi:uncharacterized protein LOC112091761 [Morus notabilis]|uniref:uncharacterized protein LOC112091761 n=1 Tax=Morus notabilis TaxID=981085 RepID=UPI000CED0FEB|nr:uncharacterized protein LOC112091761 [Morus notabilis]
MLVAINVLAQPLHKEINDLEIKVISGKLSSLTLKPTIIEHMKDSQELDSTLVRLRKEVLEGKETRFSLLEDVILYHKGKIYVPDNEEIRKQILSEAYETSYSVHLGTTKMYKNLKKGFWWPGMKKYMAEFMSKCLNCLKVKAEHQCPAGELQKIDMSEWKWDQITMDFIVGLSRTSDDNDAIWTDGQSKRPIQTLEDMLRVCFMDFKGS